MMKMLKVSEARKIVGKLVALVEDVDHLLKNGASFVDENGQLYTVKSVCMPTYDSGKVDVVFEGPDGIGLILTPVQ